MNDTTLPREVASDLDHGLKAMGLDAALAKPLLAYLTLLVRWNRTYNLTAIRDPREMVTRHLLDSLAMAEHVSSGSLADLNLRAVRMGWLPTPYDTKPVEIWGQSREEWNARRRVEGRA